MLQSLRKAFGSVARRTISFWDELVLPRPVLIPSFVDPSITLPPVEDKSLFALWFAAPKKRVSVHKRNLRRLTKWLRPKTHISICHYCDRALLPHQVLPCCFEYRRWHESGNTGTPPSLQQLSVRERKRNRELKRHEKHKAEMAKRKFVFPEETETKDKE